MRTLGKIAKKRKVFWDKKYDVGVGDKRSKRYKRIKHISETIRNCYLSRGFFDPNNQRSCHVNGLVETLELLLLETKAGHDGLFDEM